MPAFPVRLGIEIFRRAIDCFPSEKRLAVLDPCCGAGYLLTVLGITFAGRIGVLVGLDVDEKTIEIAEKNLKLLVAGGLEERRAELEELWAKFGKDSHRAAVASTHALEAERRGAEFPSAECWKRRGR